MSGDPRVAPAVRLLREQMEQLRALRNANTRDSEFKQWRQTALTAIQRLWPGDAKRSTRFRKIPFSPPSSHASSRDQREHYERGCAEALQFMEQLLQEIQRDGLPEGNGSSGPPTLSVELPDEVPTIELAPEGKLQRPSADEDEDAPPRARGRKSSQKKRLKDMLGFDDDAGSSEERVAEPEPAPEVVAAEDVESEPAASEQPDEAPPAVEAPASAADDPGAADEDGIDPFFASSPVFRASGKPVRRTARAVPEPPATESAADAAPAHDPEAPRGETPRHTVPAAVAVAMLASEVERLGVATERRASTRAALQDLADLIESGVVEWDAMREAVGLAMDSPAIGRRLLPLLIPFLDRAA